MEYLFFILTFGYAKIPGTAVPIGIIVMMIDHRRIFETFRCPIFLRYYMILIFLVILFTMRIWVSEFGDSREYSYLLSIFYKITIAPYIAVLGADIIQKNEYFTRYYVGIQSVIITTAAFFGSLFSFLLIFQTNDTQNVFVEIFGVRSIGFGIFHNEGVIALFLLYMIECFYRHRGFGLVDVLIYFSTFMSRLVLFVIPIFQIIYFRSKFAFSFLILFLAVPSVVDVTTGPLAEVYEGYINFAQGNGFYFKNGEHLSTMVVFPDSLRQWMWGDGRFFFDDGRFYMDTDIGFLRLIYFGGIPLLLFYGYLHFYALIQRPRAFPRALVLVAAYAILVANMKGLAPHPWLFLLAFKLSQNSRTVNLGKPASQNG